ncbi:hypothetical protein, partial [Salmonella enterica]|uniref:hypothetical protein n=1 Tax=Salmonella enterica TaxID=28901 RepID=UPI003075DE68
DPLDEYEDIQQIQLEECDNPQDMHTISENIGTICYGLGSGGPRLGINVLINGYKINALLDTGSTLSLVDYRCLSEELKEKVQLSAQTAVA